jgi:hypothetical protein
VAGDQPKLTGGGELISVAVHKSLHRNNYRRI